MPRHEDRCPACGATRGGGQAPLELCVGEEVRVPLLEEVTIGRGVGSTVVLDDPTVSRAHAVVRPGHGGAVVIEDAGSTAGTYVDDEPIARARALRDGCRIRMGDVELRVARRADDAPMTGTIVMGVVTSVEMRAAGPPRVRRRAVEAGPKPRLRAGVRLKRRVDDDAAGRWLISAPDGETILHLDEVQGTLASRLDGRASLSDLVAGAERLVGPGGAGQLARVLADLSDRGLLEGIDGPRLQGAPPPDGWRRLIKPREKAIRGLGPLFPRVYRAGGWVLFSRPVLALLTLVAVLGFVAAVAVVVGRYGTPFVVASHLGIGGLIFLFGRGLVVGVHELAHGLTMASYGRPVTHAGVRLVFGVLPYTFVDTSESWFEPRDRRVVVALAGPFSDLVIGGGFSLLCLLLPEGLVRDIFFQLAFAAYVGALINLNPFLDRDGYHVVVDVLGRPRLRALAQAALASRLGGKATTPDPVLRWYGVAGVAWLLVGAGLVIVLTMRYEPVMQRYAPEVVVWTVLAVGWITLFVPALLTVGKPLLARVRTP